MKVCLIGFGKMGKEIHTILLERGHEISGIITKDSANTDKQLIFSKSDVAIEFTEPDSVVENIKSCLSQGLPIVVGTTGWNQHFEAIVKDCEQNNGAIFYASNFSVGVNIFFEINKLLAELMNHQSGYHPTLKEVHHIHKKDSPSGTAHTLLNGMIQSLDSIDGWVEGEEEGNAIPNKITVVAERKGEVPGIHKVIYESEEDTLSISHSAHGRKGFAMGAVHAAEWLAGRQGVFTMKDMLNLK